MLIRMRGILTWSRMDLIGVSLSGAAITWRLAVRSSRSMETPIERSTHARAEESLQVQRAASLLRVNSPLLRTDMPRYASWRMDSACTAFTERSSFSYLICRKSLKEIFYCYSKVPRKRWNKYFIANKNPRAKSAKVFFRTTFLFL